MYEDDAEPVHRRPIPTVELAAYGAGCFVSGLFVLAAVGTQFAVAVYAWIFMFALAVAVPVGAAGVLVAAVERASGRAWLSGARRLPPQERVLRATASRGIRYASWVWLANGAALWVATVAASVA